MPFKCSGMQTILNGAIRYRSRLRGELMKQFETVNDHPNPQNMLITCIDSRIVASRVVQTSPGETLVSRNPGSLIPNYNLLSKDTPRPEEAALELACKINHVDTIVLCGHADCKAMNLVHDNRKNPEEAAKSSSVLKKWLMSNSTTTIEKFAKLESGDFKTKLKFNISEKMNFEAYIDPENNFAPHDKFSQVNALTQLENLKHYPFIKSQLEQGKLSVFAMWLDIYCGDVYVFSYGDKRFIKLDDASYSKLEANMLN